ncbi:hypothetical protein E2542_SST00192 [Spatholobus suberectus]|nr:hypothetical protein E2542_SST00192 [Spatholobus suberectus]
MSSHSGSYESISKTEKKRRPSLQRFPYDQIFNNCIQNCFDLFVGLGIQAGETVQQVWKEDQKNQTKRNWTKTEGLGYDGWMKKKLKLVKDGREDMFVDVCATLD